ncbi:MAG: TonB-dependent receptor [Comamonadaceae bacterium]|nr:TonB-dependent receptor [Comamonadaceae bacterium]
MKYLPSIFFAPYFERGRAGTLLVFLLVASHCANAQNRAELSEADFLSDMPVVLSVSRLPQRLDDTPGAVTLLDRESIRRTGARDVVDLLRLVPGFQVSNSFESVAPLASYHGAFDSYSNRLELLIDGRSAYSPFFIGSIGPGLQTVAIEDIERIEVLRGSNSAAYGARAIMGVINIVTRHSADTLGSQGALAVGENGVRDVQGQVGWDTERATFRITADRRADDGLVGSNGHNRIMRANFRSDLRLSASDEVQLRLGSYVIDSGKGFTGNVDNPPRDARFASDYAQLDWRRSLGADEDIALKLSHSQERYADSYLYSLKSLGIDDNYVVDLSGQASSDVVSLQHTLRLNNALRMVWGAEFRHEQVLSRAFFNNSHALVNDFSRLFGNLEWRAKPSVVVNLGAMAERSSVNGENFAPRLMVNWHMTAGQTLRGGVSKAFRPPSSYEKFADVRYVYKGNLLGVTTVATGQVQTENVTSREIGYLGEFPKWGLSLDVRAFHEQINGFIRQINNTVPRYYTNDESFAIKGLEYQAKWTPWAGARLVWGQSYTDIGAKTYIDDSAGFINLSGTPLAAPKLANSLTFSQQLPGQLDLTLMHQDNGTAALVGSGSGSRVAMTRTDLRLARSLRWGSRRGEMALVVQNMGVPYPDFNSHFQFQRRAYLTLRLQD